MAENLIYPYGNYIALSLNLLIFYDFINYAILGIGEFAEENLGGSIDNIIQTLCFVIFAGGFTIFLIKMKKIEGKAKEKLIEEGIDIRVIDMHTIKPIDSEIIIKAAKETKKIITIEDHSIIGGLGTAVCEVLSENYPTKVLRMGINDTFGRSGKAEELMKYYKITAEDIIENIKL